MRGFSVRIGVAVLAIIAVCLAPVVAFADAGEIRVPPGAPTASQPLSDEAEVQPPIGFWDEVLFVWSEAKIGPPIV